MQIASRQPMWVEGGRGVVIEVEMTAETGLYIKLGTADGGSGMHTIDWGDGNKTTVVTNGSAYSPHTYARTGRYKICTEGSRNVYLRDLDGQPQYSYDAAILSVVDYAGQLDGSRSGAFKRCSNLTKFIAPNCQWLGQRDFAYCTSLKEVRIGKNGICYDGTFQYCSSLEKYTCESTGICWSYVWQGCTSLTELRLGAVTQLATLDFASCPRLMDIWIDNKTVAQVSQVAPSGNIVAGYGARFPWSANAATRFHCTDGVVLGDGTIINS